MQLSNTEWTVMDVVWDRSPVRAREVLDRLEDETGWAYNTVKTILTRLVDKGALREHKEGKASVYEPLVTRAQARRKALGSLLARAFDGTFGALVQHMVAEEKLSAAERRALARMLDELDAPARSARRSTKRRGKR